MFYFGKQENFGCHILNRRFKKKRNSMLSCQRPQTLWRSQLRPAHRIPLQEMDTAALRRHFHCCCLQDTEHLPLAQTSLNKHCRTDGIIPYTSHFIVLSAKTWTCKTESKPRRSDAPVRHGGCFRKQLCPKRSFCSGKTWKKAIVRVCVPSRSIY